MKEKHIYEPYFNPEGHIYTTPDGTILDSVTQILKAELDTFNYSNNIAAKNGQNGHTVMELWDKNDLIMETLDPYFLPHLAQYILALEIEKIKILQNEVKRYHPKYLFAGGIDKIAEIINRHGIIDIKLGIPLKQYTWQVAAYKELMRHEMGADLDKYCLYLKKDKEEKYKTMGWGLEDYIKYYRQCNYKQ